MTPWNAVTWKKSNILIRSSPSHVVRAEGEQHSLLITQMRSGDAGTYCITAVNAAGKASCNATLYIKSGERGYRQTHSHRHEHRRSYILVDQLTRN